MAVNPELVATDARLAGPPPQHRPPDPPPRGTVVDLRSETDDDGTTWARFHVEVDAEDWVLDGERCVSPRSSRLYRAAKLLRHEARLAAVKEARQWPRTTRQVVCERCGDTFTTSSAAARFCSGRCRVAAHRSRGT